ncbi:ATP-binding cassette domain-containing protein [Qipengyuania spongiae]|uniref:ATP-binding cassette domain-containing protein n=1 Tax=Qipengyuania spongiae TaxID=2909673 RepID=A0ABY5SUV8_9SPHN|nr:ATP-binding cassette domain-containing protein [Qipengyuania spongiae]UVI38322.1 ATP-binding cassette domain-containing protein [Qipengyuania spongiae]
MILHLPRGYDTMIGDAHHRLSTGQAQRIALARALFGKPKLIVLDEPNSALDSEGEQALVRAVAAARLDRAAIMIVAHRAAILSTAEKLLVLEDGSVADFGPRDEILKKMRSHMEKRTVVPMTGRAKA